MTSVVKLVAHKGWDLNGDQKLVHETCTWNLYMKIYGWFLFDDVNNEQIGRQKHV